MTESEKKPVLNIKEQIENIKKSGDAYICEHCSDTFTSKRGLATHLRSCPDNSANFSEPEIKKPEINKEENIEGILDKLNLPDDIRELIERNPAELEETARQLAKELNDVISATKVQGAIVESEEKKFRKKLKEQGYQRSPVVFGNFKQVILVTLDGIAACLDRETKGGWEVLDGLCAVAPNGSVYMHFKKK